MAVNEKLLDQVMAHIEKNQELWDQDAWAKIIVNGYSGDELKRMLLDDPENPACGTAMCFAGHACALSGWKPVPTDWQIRVLEGKSSDEITSEGWDNLSYVRNKAGDEAGISSKATELLGITEADADVLFSQYNSLDELRLLCARLKKDGSLD